MRSGPFIAMLAFLLLTGCDDSKTPLSDAEKSKPDPRLAGVWRVSEDKDDVTYYHIGAAGNKLPGGVLRVFGISHRKGVVAPAETQVLMFTTTIGTGTYSNVTDGSDRQIKLLQEKGWDAVAGYFLFKYQVDGGLLSLRSMDPTTKRKAIEDGKIKGTINADRTARSKRVNSPTPPRTLCDLSPARATVCSRKTGRDWKG